MAVYKSKPAQINASADDVYGRLSNLSNLKSLMANIPQEAIPADKKEMFDAVVVSDDSISFPAGPVGEVKLKVVEKVAPRLIRLEGVGTPVPLSLSLSITPLSEVQCEASVSIDIAIPAMLKPMLGGTIQKMADQFGQVLGALKYNA